MSSSGQNQSDSSQRPAVDCVPEPGIDATSVEEQHLAGTPVPDTYLAAAKVLGVEHRARTMS